MLVDLRTIMDGGVNKFPSLPEIESQQPDITILSKYFEV